MQNIYNGYFPNYFTGGNISLNPTIPSVPIPNAASSLNVSFGNDLSPYLQQALNKIPVALNPTIPYYQNSMITFANRIPYQIISETPTTSSNLAEQLGSASPDFRLDQNKSYQEELNSSGSNCLSKGQPNLTGLKGFGYGTTSSSSSSSSLSESLSASQNSPSQIRFANQTPLTGVPKNTTSDSSANKPLQTRKEKAVKATRHRLSGSSSNGGGTTNNRGISPQELDKALSLNNNNFRNMSLKGIYYDRRNHGWQVRIRKRQTEISRYFSAKRYGVEKSYEMALRFYQVNIIGNLNNELRLARSSVNSFASCGNLGIHGSTIPKNILDFQPFLNQYYGGQLINNGAPIVQGMNNTKGISSPNSHSSSVSADRSFKLPNVNSAPMNGTINGIYPYSTQGNLEVNNQLLSHYITNSILNNILVNQMIANNLVANTMTNVRSTSSINEVGQPIHLIPKLPTTQPQIQQYGPNFASCVNSPNMVSPAPIIGQNTDSTQNNDLQHVLKEMISNALSDSDDLWKGIYYDNRNEGWRFCMEGFFEQFFSSMDNGDIESFMLAFTYKMSALKIECDVSQIRSVISNSMSGLKKIMALGNETSSDLPQSDLEPTKKAKKNSRSTKNISGLSMREKMDKFNLNELIEFISVSQKIKNIISGVPKPWQQPTPTVNFPAIPVGQSVSTDASRQSINTRQPTVNSNYYDNSIFLQAVHNNPHLLNGQFILNHPDQHRIL
ncbi:hypothetical protein OJ253_1369 [Cryptosporidium canis]|uniref:Uncharacterized protein n=1 Tax=Cryptosporidium canis TaxID=195482 RepID=A0A9D5DH74_9CRYT|nr:hypothetical protein OJ253_1369 [Cryptosporidium canis]